MNALAITTAERVSDAPATPAGLLEVGLMQLCGRDLAVPAASVREVVPMPERLHPSFSAAAASLGSVVIRGRVIPVLDIAERLGFARTGEAAVILILRHEGALVGLIMDMVSGLAKVPTTLVQPFTVARSGVDELVSSSFPHEDRLVGLIDPAAVFALPGVPLAREVAPHGGSARLAMRNSVVLISVANANLALDASVVVATVPSTHVRPSPVPGSKWVGIVEYVGQEVPVVDDLELFGLSGRAADSTSSAVVILRCGGKNMLGLKIDRIRRILPVDSTSVLPLSQTLSGKLSLFAGAVVDHEGRQNLLLDRDALVRCEPLAMIGALSRAPTSVGPPLVPGARDAGERQPFLVFRAGDKRRASPLAAVKQVIPLSQGCTGVRRPGSALQGIDSYNGAPLPLLDLSDGNCDPCIRPSNRVVLVIEAEGRYQGLIVDKLETVARSIAKPLPGPSSKGHFIEARVGERTEAVILCDLVEEADLRA